MGTPVWFDEVDGLDSGAIFSPCRRWRYLLWRRWDAEREVCMFIGLNPSTADESKDDPTVRRCMRFARDWGYGSIWVCNAFAFRATDPKVLKANPLGAVGPRNDEYLLQCARAAGIVVACWGTHAVFMDRERKVVAMFAEGDIELSAFGHSKQGHPLHPLYLSSELKPVPFDGLPRRQRT